MGQILFAILAAMGAFAVLILRGLKAVGKAVFAFVKQLIKDHDPSSKESTRMLVAAVAAIVAVILALIILFAIF